MAEENSPQDVSVQSPPADSPNQYTVTVEPPVAVSAAEAVTPAARSLAVRTRRKTAVLVCHGMGQQLQFSTLNDVVEALQSAQRRVFQARADDRYLLDENPTDQGVKVRMIRCGDTLLPRAEMTLRDAEDEELDVHLYEAYWAPLTEGKVTGLDVLWFLGGGGLSGIKFARKEFKRWIFGDWRTLPLRGSTLLLVLMAFLIVFSVSLLGFSFIAVTAAKVMGIAGLLGPNMPLADMLAAHVFACLIVLLIVALVLLALALVHKTIGRFGGKQARTKLPLVLRAMNVAAAILVFLATAPVGFSLLFHLIGTLWRHPSWLSNDSFRVTQGLHEYFFRLPNYRLLYLALWGLSALAFYFARYFLIQYVGDVAIYVSAHKVNKFFEVRQQIKDAGLKAARAAYEARNEKGNFEYDELLVVGHSLGSVVAYDTLNSMINRDLVETQPLDVIGRTKTLLTFGSPLDKTAFLFRAQADEQLVRESLAAAVQPLIQSYEYRHRLRWINIWSRLDWISGTVDYYDDPSVKTDPANPDHDKAVEDIEDLEASFPLAAHTQYWGHRIFADALYAEVVRRGANV